MSGRSVILTKLSLCKPPGGSLPVLSVLSPLTDTYSSLISGRGRLAAEIFYDQIFTKECTGCGGRYRTASLPTKQPSKNKQTNILQLVIMVDAFIFGLVFLKVYSDSSVLREHNNEAFTNTRTREPKVL